MAASIFIGLLGLSIGLGALGGYFWDRAILAAAWPCLYAALFVGLGDVIWWTLRITRRYIGKTVKDGKELTYDISGSVLWEFREIVGESSVHNNPGRDIEKEAKESIELIDEAIKKTEKASSL